jgi:hypothetical protein
MNVYTDDERLHHEAAAQAQRDRYLGRALAAGHKPDERRQFAREVEALIADRLRSAGHCVARTGHCAHYDLLCDGVRIEVKAAALSGKRYQAALRSNDADVLILCCRGPQADRFFVMPFDQVKGLTHLKISQIDPVDYVGRYKAWLEAWPLIDEMIARGVNHWQMGLL